MPCTSELPISTFSPKRAVFCFDARRGFKSALNVKHSFGFTLVGIFVALCVGRIARNTRTFVGMCVTYLHGRKLNRVPGGEEGAECVIHRNNGVWRSTNNGLNLFYRTTGVSFNRPPAGLGFKPLNSSKSFRSLRYMVLIITSLFVRHCVSCWAAFFKKDQYSEEQRHLRENSSATASFWEWLNYFPYTAHLFFVSAISERIPSVSSLLGCSYINISVLTWNKNLRTNAAANEQSGNLKET